MTLESKFNSRVLGVRTSVTCDNSLFTCPLQVLTTIKKALNTSLPFDVPSIVKYNEENGSFSRLAK